MSPQGTQGRLGDARRDAKAQLKTETANAQTARTAATANHEAGERGGAAARKDAASTKRDTD
jgi:hypothetical protein